MNRAVLSLVLARLRAVPNVLVGSGKNRPDEGVGMHAAKGSTLQIETQTASCSEWLSGKRNYKKEVPAVRSAPGQSSRTVSPISLVRAGMAYLN
jgi:hypothetical protein